MVCFNCLEYDRACPSCAARSEARHEEATFEANELAATAAVAAAAGGRASCELAAGLHRRRHRTGG